MFHYPWSSGQSLGGKTLDGFGSVLCFLVRGWYAVGTRISGPTICTIFGADILPAFRGRLLLQPPAIVHSLGRGIGGRPSSFKLELRASSFKLQAASFKLQASSFKLQASCFRLETATFKLQLQDSHFKLQASSLELQASSFRLHA